MPRKCLRAGLLEFSELMETYTSQVCILLDRKTNTSWTHSSWWGLELKRGSETVCQRNPDEVFTKAGTHLCSSRRVGHTGGLATGIWSPVLPPASCLQAVLWRWAPLGWLYDHCAPWAAEALCCAGFLLPSAQSPETWWQRWDYQKRGMWKLHKDRHVLLKVFFFFWECFSSEDKRCPQMKLSFHSPSESK